MLGFSGGRKLIAPGLAAQETIKVLHSPKFMRDTRATEGSVADNPLHRELLEIARMARHDFMRGRGIDSRAEDCRRIRGGSGASACCRNAVCFPGDAGRNSGTTRCSDYQLRRIPARPDVLSGNQRHHCRTAHRKAGRPHPVDCRVLRRPRRTRVLRTPPSNCFVRGIPRVDSRSTGHCRSVATREACTGDTQSRSIVLHSRTSAGVSSFFMGPSFRERVRSCCGFDGGTSPGCRDRHSPRRTLCSCACERRGLINLQFSPTL